MNPDKFINGMGEAWVKKLEPFLLSEDCNNIFRQLKKEQKIFPLSEDLFKSFRLVSPENINCILIGLDPYIGFFPNGKPKADGLAFSNSYSNGEIQPSLEKLLSGMALDEMIEYEEYKTNDLTYLTEQGVLLLNKSLTIPLGGKAGDHLYLWEKFYEFFFSLIDEKIPIISYGKEANKIEKYLKNSFHINIPHPSWFARNDLIMDAKGAYNDINKYLRKEKEIAIKWCISSWKKSPEIDWMDSNLVPF